MQELLDIIRKTTENLALKYNEETLDYNKLVEELEEKDTTTARQDEALEVAEDTLKKQGAVIAASIVVKKADSARIILLEATSKELSSMNPKRLMKTNKTYKQRVEQLKVDLESVKKQRTALTKENQKLRKEAVKLGESSQTKCFYINPDNNNYLRVVPGTFVSKDNEFGGVTDSPVLEYFNSLSGVSRQGVLTSEGTVNWSSAKNSMPSKDESLIAQQKLLEYCKQLKIKLN